ncbi:MAG TPA: FliM/FliN family flagellar motor switch protein [Terriglobales bacterium]|nr:FliM/FliN family flagellar motor switch protein [Terriglobales bacterium]
MSDSEANVGIREFAAQWARNISQLLSQLGVESPSVTPTDPASPASAAQPELVTARFVCGGVLKGELQWLAEKSAALLLAQLLMSEPPDPAIEFSDNHRDAFAELLRQVAGLTATSWKQASGGETLISYHSAAEPVFSSNLESFIRISTAKSQDASLRLQLNAELCQSLSSAPAPEIAEPGRDSQDAPESAQTLAASPAPFSESVPPSAPLPPNLDLLLDVELEATIRFGEREMLLREVMSLMPGAVVELDQLVNEPADLLVAGRLVARGEVVVVDGNFGLRVTEVASMSQRAKLVPVP